MPQRVVRLLVGPPWARFRFRGNARPFLAMLLLSVVQAAQACDTQCQEQQGLAVQRVLQGLLGPGQTLDIFASAYNSGLSDYTARQAVGGFLNYTAMAAAGHPRHCLLPGVAPCSLLSASVAVPLRRS